MRRGDVEWQLLRTATLPFRPDGQKAAALVAELSPASFTHPIAKAAARAIGELVRERVAVDELSVFKKVRQLAEFRGRHFASEFARMADNTYDQTMTLETLARQLRVNAAQAQGD